MIERKLVSLGIIIGIVMGVCLVAYAGSTTYVSSEAITPPGVPINESSFAYLGNDTDLENSIIMKCNWSKISDTPLRYELTLLPRVLPTNYTLELAEQALNEIYSENLSRVIEPSDIHSSIPHYLRSNIDYYQFIYENVPQSPLLIEIGINNINGRTVEYTEYWSDNDTIPITLNTQSPYDGNIINSSIAESIALDFLRQYGYSVPTTSVHARTSLVLARQLLDNSTYNVYEIVIRSQTNAIFPDRYADGITIHISEFGGHITHLACLLLDLPEIGDITVLNPEVDYRNVGLSMQFKSWNETSSLVATYLRLVPCLDPEGSFALSWRYELQENTVEGVVFPEIGSNDALMGTYLYPGLYRSTEMDSIDVFLIPVVILSTALALGLLLSRIYNNKSK